MGATLPGCPLFAVARTERLAWGVTYMKGDTSDYFIEDCRRGGATGWQYRRGDNWLDFSVREETISRKSNGTEHAANLFQPARHARRRSRADRRRALSLDRLDRQRSGRRTFDRHVAADRRQPPMRPRRWTSPEVARSRRCAGSLPTATGHIGLQGCGSFPKRRAGLQRPVADSRLGRAQSLARPDSQPTCCRAFTIRRRDLSRRPTKTSIRPAVRS